MKLSNISLPYPVLGLNDDILPGLPDDALKINKPSQKDSVYKFKVDLSLNNPQIEKFIEDGYAVYVCEVDCVATLQRYSITSKTPHFDVEIRRNRVAGVVSFHFYVTVVKPINHYVNDGFNEDYQDCSFDMEVGDILVGFPSATYDTELQYDKLQAAGSYMQIREEPNKNYTNIDVSGNIIDIKLPTQLFQMYVSGIGQSFSEVMHTSMAYPALVTALFSLQNDYNATHNNYWARSIKYRIETEKELNELATFNEDGVIFHEDLSLVASMLLNDPYNRMFNCLSNISGTETDTEE